MTTRKAAEDFCGRFAASMLHRMVPADPAALAIPTLYRRLFHCFLEILAEDIVPLRPNRSEPRVVKRGPENC